jgi:hypothetical protein
LLQTSIASLQESLVQESESAQLRAAPTQAAAALQASDVVQ